MWQVTTLTHRSENLLRTTLEKLCAEGGGCGKSRPGPEEPCRQMYYLTLKSGSDPPLPPHAGWLAREQRIETRAGENNVLLDTWLKMKNITIKWNHNQWENPRSRLMSGDLSFRSAGYRKGRAASKQKGGKVWMKSVSIWL